MSAALRFTHAYGRMGKTATPERLVFNVPDPSQHGHWMRKGGGAGVASGDALTRGALDGGSRAHRSKNPGTATHGGRTASQVGREEESAARTQAVRDKAFLKRQTIERGDKVEAAGHPVHPNGTTGTVRSVHKDGTYTVAFKTRNGEAVDRTRAVTLLQKGESFARAANATTSGTKSGTKVVAPRASAKPTTAKSASTNNIEEQSRHLLPGQVMRPNGEVVTVKPMTTREAATYRRSQQASPAAQEYEKAKAAGNAPGIQRKAAKTPTASGATGAAKGGTADRIAKPSAADAKAAHVPTVGKNYTPDQLALAQGQARAYVSTLEGMQRYSTGRKAAEAVLTGSKDTRPITERQADLEALRGEIAKTLETARAQSRYLDSLPGAMHINKDDYAATNDLRARTPRSNADLRGNYHRANLVRQWDVRHRDLTGYGLGDTLYTIEGMHNAKTELAKRGAKLSERTTLDTLPIYDPLRFRHSYQRLSLVTAL